MSRIKQMALQFAIKILALYCSYSNYTFSSQIIEIDKCLSNNKFGKTQNLSIVLAKH